MDAVIKAYNAQKIKGMVLPPVPLGAQNPGQRELPFCLPSRYETQKAILTDIVASLDYQGIYTLVIVNGHGGNSFKNMVRDLAVDYPHFLIVVSDWFAVLSQTEYFEEKDDHAGEMETSVIMHYYPELVSLSVVGNGAYTPFKPETQRDGTGWTPRNWTQVSQDTGMGNPKKSTAEKGEAVTQKLSELFVDLVKGELY